MKLLVGYLDNAIGKDALKLGIVLAEMLKSELVICQILPKPAKAKKSSKVDEEYHQFLHEEAKKSLDKVKLEVPSHIDSQYVIRCADSPAQGLLQTAKDMYADIIVIGSDKMALNGEFILGKVTQYLLNHATIPSALAPKGFHKNHGFSEKITRLSCAISGSKKSYELAETAAEWAAMFDVPLRFVTFGVRDTDITPTAAGFDAENIIINEWRDQLQAGFDHATEHWESEVPISLEIGGGDNWKKSIRSVTWSPNEILLIGFNKPEKLKHLFTSHDFDKIVRYGFVPRLVLPRLDK